MDLVQFALGVFVVLALITAIIVALVTYGLVRGVRAVHRNARRARMRVAESLPMPQSFGRQVWWVASRLDRVEDQADVACGLAAGTPFRSDVYPLAARTRHEVAQLRHYLRRVSPLSGAAREAALRDVEPHVAGLEEAARSLVALAERVQRQSRPANWVPPTTEIRNRANSLMAALDEIDRYDAVLAPELRAEPKAAPVKREDRRS